MADTNSHNENNQGQRDRRAAPRAQTDRATLFSGVGETALPREGHAVNLSRNGLLIVTEDPAPPGSSLDIELRPTPGDATSGTITIRGHVVRADPLPAGEYAMGVRLHVAGGQSGPGLKDAAEAHALIKQAHERLKDKDQTESVLAVFREAPADSSVEEDEPQRKKWLVLFLLGLLLLGGTAIVWRAANGRFWPPRDRASVAREEDDNSHRSTATAGATQPAGLLLDAQTAMFGGNPMAALQAFEALERRPDASATEAFLASLGQAQALGAMGRTGEALTLVQRAQGLAARVHYAWKDFLADLRLALLQGEEGLENAPRLEDAFELDELDTIPVTAAGEVHIEVDKQAYVLSIVRDGEVVRAFPVGLGCDDATPSGAFAIAVKLTDPAWYNKGDVVAPEDPNNPIGRRWMGLGDEQGPTSYGIHPTNTPDSIGQPQSRGCIRMRPEDAETVFRLCPIGTPVTVKP